MISITLVLLAAAALAADDGQWISPFDGKTLNGWKQTGNADWRVEDGAIVGRQGPNGAPGDLFTEAQWKDFEIEAEWRMVFPGNSGLWFRWSGPKTGCQADFLENEKPYPNVYSGSVYCMGRQFIGVNRDPSVVNRTGWNKLRMRVAGEEVVVQLNGKEVVRTRNDSQSGAGSIGIQVHAGEQFKGMEVRLRNIRLRPIGEGKR